MVNQYSKGKISKGKESAELILLDNYEAREFARTYGLKITDTIGILIKAK